MYDPNTGRFINKDPIGLRGGTNLYRYGANNPVDMTDPFGFCGGFVTISAGTTQGPFTGQVSGTLSIGTQNGALAASASAGGSYSLLSGGFSLSGGVSYGFYSGDISTFNAGPTNSWSFASFGGGFTYSTYSDNTWSLSYDGTSAGLSATYSDSSSGASTSASASISSSTGSSYFDNGYTFGGQNSGSGYSLGVDTDLSDDDSDADDGDYDYSDEAYSDD
jgi:hypothetical protein